MINRKFTELLIKHCSLAFLCNSLALAITELYITVTIGFNVTSVKCPPPLEVSNIFPVVLLNTLLQ